MRHKDIAGAAEALFHPSLALVKYWGKLDAGRNLPATPSLAVTLDGVSTRTRVTLKKPKGSKSKDRVLMNGVPQNLEFFTPFFQTLRSWAEKRGRFELSNSEIHVDSHSDFPASAGFASSASGFGGLTAAAVRAAGIRAETAELSSLARLGSASAARTFWGGFVWLDAGAEVAEPFKDENWWPALSILLLQVSSEPKPLSSREAMERSKRTSPYYKAWVTDAPALAQRARKAVEERNLDMLGALMRQSYQRMFASMMAADPPILYWLPETVALLRFCETLRSEGLPVWETMDAGPQVKLFVLENHLQPLLQRLSREFPNLLVRTCRVGGPPRVHELS